MHLLYSCKVSRKNRGQKVASETLQGKAAYFLLLLLYKQSLPVRASQTGQCHSYWGWEMSFPQPLQKV
ncbi:hypothetical protein KOW79_018892 [Hemibagrus wyckioides]|uniref:Uncharacterized protein n=1 Tax=Hemibagrus wyckioides TaxID=337641 RepID=A0A9D3SBF4_9TELE|nr:hypothetical protein KOW79_018892 [Hemibagrus wyckioides]